LGHAYDVGKPHYFDIKNYPNEIHINGEKQEGEIKYQYNVKQEINYVELIWYKNIKNASCMFHGGSSITEIDFSNFNTSEITNMYYMFRLCSSLTSINFTNFDTSKVTEMSFFFC
jgi:surface protein